MMERREFLKRCALIAAGVVAADQLDVLEMLAPRRLFAGADFHQPVGLIDCITSRSVHGLKTSSWDQHGRIWVMQGHAIPDGGYEVVLT